MHRLVVALLAAFDALIAAAVGVVFVLAPLTVFWATGADAPWGALWPTTAAIWQSGHFVPIILHLPEQLLVAAGVSREAATFTFSLAPLGFAAFAALFGARSGTRAARSGAWMSGVLSGGIVYAAIGGLVWWTSRNGTAAVWGWQALLFPALVYGLPLLTGALITAWREGDGGLVDRVHDALDEHDVAWSELPALLGRGLAMILVGFIGLGALAMTVAVIVRGGDVVALYQSARVDVWGAILMTLGGLIYLPTLLVWGFAWLAGPGFTLGTGATVTPVGTQVGAVPGIPVLGLVPEGGSIAMLAVVLLPIAIAGLAGWALRSRLAELGIDDDWRPRVALTAALALISAGVSALIAVLASGSIGPGRMADLGPHPGWLALAIGIEVLVGVGVILLPPSRDAVREDDLVISDVEEFANV